MRFAVFLFALLVAMAPALARAETCRLALVLALDVSGSVNEVEYAQQLNGLAFALDSTEVRRAILADPGAPVELTVFEWSSQNHQFIVLPWIALRTEADIDLAVSRILAFRKKRAGLKTALSTAMLFAGSLLEDRRQCWQQVVDVSGDGKNNIGPAMSSVYRLSQFADVTVNALVVGNPSSDNAEEVAAKSQLMRYYEREVIKGPSAFAMIANGYQDYARAMKRKLLRELSLPVLGARDE